MIMTHTLKRSRSKVRRVEHSENRQTDRTDFVTFLSNAVANKCISLRTAGSRRTLTAGWVFPVAVPMLANAAALLLLLLLRERQTDKHYLPTVILIIISIPSPTHSFTLGLNPSISANPPYRSLSFFSFRIHYMNFPDCSLLLLSISVFFTF